MAGDGIAQHWVDDNDSFIVKGRSEMPVMRSGCVRIDKQEGWCEIAHTINHGWHERILGVIRHRREACHIHFWLLWSIIRDEIKPLFHGPRLFFAGGMR